MNEIYCQNSFFVINECISLYNTAFYTYKTQVHEVRQATVVCHITNTEICCCLVLDSKCSHFQTKQIPCLTI